jgi:hypothetical protein
MTKLALPLSLGLIAGLAACATYDTVTPAPTPVVVSPAPAPAVVAAPAGTYVLPNTVAVAPSTVVLPAAPALRAGIGRVESISATPMISAATGASVASSSRRVALRMNDGTLQLIDTDAPGLSLGDRVEITGDGYIRRPAS